MPDAEAHALLLEARTAVQLEHPRFVRVYACGILAELSLPYLSMEYLRGETLRSRLHKAQTPAEVLRWCGRVLEGKILDLGRSQRRPGL